jgi:hypothetical protein
MKTPALKDLFLSRIWSEFCGFILCHWLSLSYKAGLEMYISVFRINVKVWFFYTLPYLLLSSLCIFCWTCLFIFFWYFALPASCYFKNSLPCNLPDIFKYFSLSASWWFVLYVFVDNLCTLCPTFFSIFCKYFALCAAWSFFLSKINFKRKKA